MRRCSVYVAGGSSEAALVSSYMRRLEAFGFTITHDWTVIVLDHQARGVTDAKLTLDEAEAHARADLDGVVQADCVWLIAPIAKSEGGWFEMGVAVGDGESHTIVSGITHNIFRTKADMVFARHEEALAYITRGVVPL